MIRPAHVMLVVIDAILVKTIRKIVLLVRAEKVLQIVFVTLGILMMA